MGAESGPDSGASVPAPRGLHGPQGEGSGRLGEKVRQGASLLWAPVPHLYTWGAGAAWGWGGHVPLSASKGSPILGPLIGQRLWAFLNSVPCGPSLPGHPLPWGGGLGTLVTTGFWRQYPRDTILWTPGSRECQQLPTHDPTEVSRLGWDDSANRCVCGHRGIRNWSVGPGHMPVRLQIPGMARAPARQDRGHSHLSRPQVDQGLDGSEGLAA